MSSSQALQALVSAIQIADADQVARLLSEHPSLPLDWDQDEKDASPPPLLLAVKNRQPALVSLLLDAGARLEVRDHIRRTPLFLAYANSDLAMAALLMSRGADTRARNKLGTRILDAAIACGDFTTAQAIVAQGEPLQHVNEEGTTTLHRACAAGMDMVAWVRAHTDHRLDQRNDQGLRPIDWVENVALYRACIELQPGIELNPRFKSGNHPIHRFARNGRTDIVAELLDRGVDIHLKGSDGNSILHNAVISGRRDLVTLLLDRGANLEARNKHSYRPVHWVADSDDVDMMALLIAHGAKFDAKASTSFIIREMRTPLYLAIDENHEAMAKYLIEQGADPNVICDTSHATALVAACRGNKVDLVRMLLAHGAQPNGVNRGDKSIDYYYFPLAVARSAEVVELLVNAGADVNAANQYQETALHWLAQLESDELAHPRGQGQLAAMAALIRLGADPDLRDMHGRTPQSWAKTKEVTALLLEARQHRRASSPMSADQDGRQKDLNVYRSLVTSLAEMVTGRTAPERPSVPELGKEIFDRAHDCTKPSEVEALIEMIKHASKGDVTYISPDSYYNDETILHRVISSARRLDDDHEVAPLVLFDEAVQLLVARGADVNAVETLYDETPLHKVCRIALSKHIIQDEAQDVGHLQSMIQALLNRGADINAENENGSTPLDFIRHEPLFKFMLQRGARFGARNEALFYIVAYEFEVDSVRLLLDNGVSIEARNGEGDTALLVAAKANEVDTVKALLALGADPRALGEDQTTLLHAACDEGALDLVRYAVEQLAPDLNAQDAFGQTPLCLLLAHAAGLDKGERKHAEDAALFLVGQGARLDILDEDGDTPLAYAATKKLEGALKKAAKTHCR